MRSPKLVIRPMTPSDLPFAASCTAAEGWLSENLTTLQGFYLHDPQGCLLAELDGQPVGMGIATSYGKSGFIGELIVRPGCRGSGVGATLLNRAVSSLQSRGAQTVYLDGVVKAVPLYERNGFRKICRSWRFSGKLTRRVTPQVRAMQPDDLPAVYALDLQAFGVNRSFFLRCRLELFPELCKVWVEGERLVGFILGRRGEGWVSAGPWVVAEDKIDLTGNGSPVRSGESQIGALFLLESLACEAGDIPISLGVLDTHHQAVNLLRSLGFKERSNSPWRMALGPSRGLGASPQCLAVGTAAKG